MSGSSHKSIQILPPQIANQIAAGEVVERPASIVKELIENSLDAGASQIDIIVKSGGLQSIQVTDNGVGIPEQQLKLAVCRHATSKISKIDDLYSLDSMGFRGEALASIASVTRFKLVSCTSDMQHAACWHNLNNKPAVEPAAHPMGTTVHANELFFNTPVRRRFIKSERTEFKHIEDVVKQMALSHPHVGFTLKHNQRNSLQLPRASSEQEYEQRLLRVLGKVYAQNLIKLDFESGGLALRGYLAAPSVERSQSDMQFIYNNNRIVRDKVLLHALKQVMQPLLYPGKQAVCVLFLTLPTDQVDVNVHPTKHEVRFTSPRLVHDFVVQVLQASLDRINPAEYVSVADAITSYKPGLTNESNVNEPVSTYASGQNEVSMQWQSEVFGRYLGLYQQQYALFEHAKGLYVVDMQKAFVTCVRQCLTADTESASKHLLMPIEFDLGPGLASKAEHLVSAARSAGFRFVLADNKIRLIAVPGFMASADLSSLLSGLVADLNTEFGISDINEAVCNHTRWAIANVNDVDVQECLLKLPAQNACARLITNEILLNLFENPESIFS